MHALGVGYSEVTPSRARMNRSYGAVTCTMASHSLASEDEPNARSSRSTRYRSLPRERG